MNKLQELRKLIDIIDKDILELIAKRMLIAGEIAKHKKEKEIKIFQPEREKEILEKKKELAKKLGISNKFAEKILLLLINESKRVQKDKLKN